MKILGYNVNITRNKMEERSVPSNPSSQVPDAVVSTGVGLTSVLRNFNTSNPMAISAVYSATSIISSTIASIPINVRKEDKEGYQTVIPIHPLYDMLDDNESQITRFEMIKYVVTSVLLKGNGYIYIYRDNTGKATGLRWIPNEYVSINYNPLNNNLYYICPLVDKKAIEPVNMLHFKINSDDGINGRSIVSYAARSIRNANATENSAVNFYDSGCNLNGIIKVQGSLTPQQKSDIKTSWRESMDGQGLAVLQGNMDYTPIQMNVADAQLIESRQFNVSDIARFFSISPVLLGDLSHSSYNTLEAAQLDLITRTLIPYITVIEQEFNRKLWTPSEKKIGFNVNLDEVAILRTDKKSQADYYTKMLEKGILSINECRQALGYPSIEGGDLHVIAYSDPDQNAVEDKPDNEPKEE